MPVTRSILCLLLAQSCISGLLIVCVPVTLGGFTEDELPLTLLIVCVCVCVCVCVSVTIGGFTEDELPLTLLNVCVRDIRWLH